MAAPAAFTATAVSLDQITLTWTPEAGSLIDIERSLDNLSWTRVYHCPSDDGSCKLFSHEPSTLYYFRARHYAGAGVASAYSSTTSDTTSAANTTYYVRKDGNNGNLGTTDSAGGAFASIQYAIDAAVAGDQILLGDGSWTEAHPTLGDVSMSGQGNIEQGGVAFSITATEASPVVLRSNPNNTSNAILDSNHIFGGSATFSSGIYLAGQTAYVHIRNLEIKNCMAAGIHSYDSPSSTWLSSGTLGCVIEGCTIHHVGGADNDGGIKCSNSKDFIIRNNRIYDIYGWPIDSRTGAYFHTFGTQNVLIENNYCTPDLTVPSSAGCGSIVLKDHYPDDAVIESEIRYNYVAGTGPGVMVLPQGAGSRRAHSNYIHHNILVSQATGEDGVLYIAPLVGETTTEPQIAAHNTIVNTGPQSTSSFVTGGCSDVTLTGNIFIGSGAVIVSRYYNVGTQETFITSSDYNIFDSGAGNTAILNQYKLPNTVYYSSLSLWQAAPLSLYSVASPDANSDTSTSFLSFNDAGAGDYSLKAGASAIGLMADGSDAGAYQFGVENIGLFVAESSIVSGSTVEANGLTFEIDFTTAITDAGTILPAHFTIAGSTVSAAVLTSSTLVTLTISSTAIEQGAAAPLITYTQPGTGLQEGGVDIPTFETTPVNNSTVDTTAPVLISPLGTPTGNTTATGTVTTDEGNGTLYWEVTASATPTSPNATFISDATAAGDTQVVSATGSQIVSVTGLTAATSYYIHFLHVDAATNESNVSTSAQFTTTSLTAPTLLGGLGNPFIPVFSASGSVLTLTFSEAVTTSVATGLTLSTGEVLTYNSGSTTNTIVYDVFPYAQVGGAILNFAGGANLIESTASGADVEAFSDFIVNGLNVSTPPVVVGDPTVDETGTVLTVVFSSASLANQTTPVYSPFTLTGTLGGVYTFTNASIPANTGVFTVSPAVEYNDVLSLSFTQAGGTFTDGTTGIELATFTDTVVNNTSSTDNEPPIFTSAPDVSKITVQGHSIRQTINETGVVYGVRLPAGSGIPSAAQVKAGTDSLGAAAPEAKSVATTAGSPCVLVFSSGAKNTEYDYYIVAEDSVPNLQAGAQILTATTANLLFNGSGGKGLRPDEDSKKKVKMMWDSKNKRR
ncbi:right-handed parallel beta-helix repeat-containing protein [Flavobacteriaceae bacterium]|nr:right-handed parallel beta-helix repeat-containing protein [Flavobacteriaceae bacterium]